MSPRPRHLLEFALARVFMTAVRSLGPSTALRAARGVAGLFLTFDARHRARALENLARSLPELDPEERLSIVRSAFRSFAMTLTETLFIDRTLSAASLAQMTTIDVHPAARAAVDEGRGAIFVTAHIGNWELIGAASAMFGFPLVTVARPLGNPLLQRYVLAHRERFGQRIISKRGAVRELARALREKRFLALVVDQNTGRDGVFVPFFGRLASTTPAPATLSLRFRAPLIPVWSRRGADGRIHIRLEAPIPAPGTGDREEDVRKMTAAMTARVEAWVREEPGQWLWGHRRWKTRPPGEGRMCVKEVP